MEIKRKLDTSNASYDLTNLTDAEFTMLYKAYEYYANYTRHAPPSDEDSMWSKMQRLMNDRITIV